MNVILKKSEKVLINVNYSEDEIKVKFKKGFYSLKKSVNKITKLFKGSLFTLEIDGISIDFTGGTFAKQFDEVMLVWLALNSNDISVTSLVTLRNELQKGVKVNDLTTLKAVKDAYKYVSIEKLAEINLIENKDYAA